MAIVTDRVWLNACFWREIYVAVTEHVHYYTQPLGVRTVLQSNSCCTSKCFSNDHGPLSVITHRTPATPGWSRSSWARWMRTTTGSWLSLSSGSSLGNWRANREASISRAHRLSVSCGFQHIVQCQSTRFKLSGCKLKGILLSLCRCRMWN